MHDIIRKFNRSRKPQREWRDGAIMPLAKCLAKAKGCCLYFMGPFGLRSACTLVLYADKAKKPLEQEHWSITVMPHFVGDNTEIWYDTYKTVQTYPEGSIGALNNLGNETLPLPGTTDEILTLMYHSNSL